MDDRPPAGVPGLHAIVLAAGSASRYGSPKLLAPVDGIPMLARAIGAAVAAVGPEAVTVVLGAEAAQLEPLVHTAAAAVVVNLHFEEGIASSIRAGMAKAPAGTRGAMILLADQVAVTADDLQRLLAGWERRPDRIVAARYGDATGAPAIFPADLFPELAALEGDRGARALLARHPDRVVAVPMPSAAIDVDTPADLDTRPSHTTAE